MYLIKDYNLLGYARFNEEERMIILINNNDNSYHMEVYIPVERVGLFYGDRLKVIFRSNISSYSTKEEIVDVIDGHIKVGIDAYSAIILTDKF